MTRLRLSSYVSCCALAVCVAASCGRERTYDGSESPDGAAGEAGSSAVGPGGQSNEGGQGGQGGQAPSGPLAFVTEALPNAYVNLPYSEQVLVTGGVGKVTLKATELPPGLSLSEDGTLSGQPSSLGKFEVTISATDEGGTTVDLKLELSVIRKAWIAYRTDGFKGLYLVNVAKASPTLTPLVLGTAADVDVLQYAFSPDGNMLAYAADPTTDGVYELFVVDLTSASGPSTKRVNTTGSVTAFDWSPNSSSVAFFAGSNAAVYVSEIDGDRKPKEPESAIAATSGNLNFPSGRPGLWAGNDALIVRMPINVAVAKWGTNGAWSAPEEVAAYSGGLGLWKIAHDTQRVALYGQGELPKGAPFDAGLAPSGMLDFRTTTHYAAGVAASFVNFAYTDDCKFSVRPLADACAIFDTEDDSAALVTDPDSSCMGATWTRDGRFAAFENTAGRMRVVGRETKKVKEVPGAYPSSWRALFSNDSQWLAFYGPDDYSTTRDLNISRIVDGMPSEPISVASYPDATQGLGGAVFSGNSKSLVFLADGATPGQEELYQVALGTTASTSTKISSKLEATGAVVDADFTTDSSFVVYRSRYSDVASYDLQVIDQLSGTGTSIAIDGQAGLGVADFLVQP